MYSNTSHRIFIVSLGVLLAGASACAGARPQVNVIGVAAPMPQDAPVQRETIVMFVEVVNPTSRNLDLQRLEYRFAAESWFSAAGEVTLDRTIGANGAAVIEVPVSFRRADAAERVGDVPYRLEGRLYAVDDRVERSWPVQATGVIEADVVADARRGLRSISTRIAADGR